MAGNSRIQGITVEIGGDTGPLSKALQGVNKEIQGTQSQLKDVERLLKMDPGNTELLQQKQRLLGDAIGETKTKLEALKTAEQQAQAQFQKGEISQKQYDGLKREIADTEIKLKGLEKSYKDFGNVASQALKNASESIKGFGEKTVDIGKKFLPVTAGVAGLGAAAVKVGMDFDSSMSQVAATMGITTDEIAAGSESLDLLRQAAKDAGATTAFSATEAAQALNYLALAGYDAKTSSEVLPTVLNLAAAGGMDLAYASDLATDAMAALGIEATSANLTQFGDKMAKTASKANTSVSQLGEAILTVGGTAKSLSGGTTELNTALGLLANEGTKGSEAGTALRNIILSLTAPTDKAADEMKTLGLDVADASGNMRPLNEIFKDLDSSLSQMSSTEKTQVLNKIFNKTDLKSVQTLLANCGKEYDNLSTAVENSAGAMQNMADTQLDNMEGQITLLKSQLEGIGISISELVIPKIREILTAVSEWLTKFANLDDGTKKLIVTIAGIAAAIGPALIVIGKLSTGFGSVVGIVGKVVGLFSGGGGLVAALGAITGPVGIVVAAVGALVAIFATLFATNEDFRNKVGEIWSQIQQIFSSVLEQIKGIIQGFIDVANAILKNFGAEIMAVVSAAFDFIKTYIDSAMKVVKDVIDVVMGLINGDWERVWNGLKNLVSDVLNGIMNIIGSWQQLVQKAFELLGSVLGNVWTAIKGVALQAWEGIKTSVLGIVENIKTGVINGFNNLKSGVTTTVGNVATAIKNGLGKAVDYVKGLPSKFLGWGKDMIQGLINGIKSKISAVADAVSSVANKVKNFLHFSRPDEGPLRDYETWMPDFMSGLAAGIRRNTSRVTQALGALTDNMTIDMQPVMTPAVAGASGGPQTITQPVSISVEIERMDNSSGQAPRAIAEQINTELQRIQQRSKAQW